jgi:hypothetical protein
LDKWIKKIIIMNKELCDCGNVAVWLYLPGFKNGNNYCCENCVPRGCECNHYHINMNSEFNHIPEEKDGIENIDWKWLNTEKTWWTHLDDNGLEFPCCEFIHDTDGFENE